jgi:CheY-like chemotaxis protein
MLEAFGFEAVGVRSLAEARELIDSDSLCMLLTDLRILPGPHDTEAEPDLGLELVDHARLRYPGHRGPHCYLFPIIVTSGLDSGKFRDALHKGMNDFLPKPIGANKPTLKQTVEHWFAQTGRRDHGDCAEVTRQSRVNGCVAPPIATTSGNVRLGVTGRTFGNHSEVTIDGTPVRIPNYLFGPLLQLISGRHAGLEWTSREDLGADPGDSWRGKSQLEKELKALLRGRSFIKNNKGRGYRLEDDVELDAIVVKPLATEDGSMISAAAHAILALQKKKRTGTY